MPKQLQRCLPPTAKSLTRTKQHSSVSPQPQPARYNREAYECDRRRLGNGVDEYLVVWDGVGKAGLNLQSSAQHA